MDGRLLDPDASLIPDGPLSVQAIEISKRFGDVHALDEVSLQVDAASFHCLLGENGAGKSTLVKCLAGFYRQDSGSFLLAGREQDIRNPKDAHKLGIGMVYQHFTVASGMTVAENLLLARDDLPGLLNLGREHQALQSFMVDMSFRLDLSARVADLAAGEKQKLEILKQLYQKRRLLILDEPTSVLTPAEADEVLGMLHQLTRQQKLTVLMITHKFREVTAYADAVTVLRRGRLAGAGRLPETGTDDMARMMMGGPESRSSQTRPEPTTGTTEQGAGMAAERLIIRNLQGSNDRGVPAIHQLDLVVRAGEMVGVAGVSGNGQKELVEILLGQREANAGEILVDGLPYRATRNQMRMHGVYSLPEEPLRNACVGSMSVAENMALRNFDQAPATAGWRTGWFLRRSRMVARSRSLIAEFGVRPPDPMLPISGLSGGNVQRAVLARELGQPVNLLIVANPVFGLDFAAAAAIHQRLCAARDAGAAILLVSEDLDELLALTDRLVVMSAGRIVHAVATAKADPVEIGHHMAGGHAGMEDNHEQSKGIAV